MDKPKEAVERMRELYKHGYAWDDCCKTIIAYLDSIPDDAHIVQWPKELTRERLELEASHLESYGSLAPLRAKETLRALAAIAPVKKKRMVNLWRTEDSHPNDRPFVFPTDFYPNKNEETGHKYWRKVNKEPIEIED